MENDTASEAAEEAPNGNSSITMRAALSGAPQTTRIIQAAHDDPIFGRNGIMHDIVISQNKKNGYRISMDFHRPSSKVFGHNGLAIGTVWPRQVAAFRDGAHGRIMHGISGTAKEGCYSIVISGLYDSIDEDLGDIVYYSDSKALSSKSDHPVLTPGTESLRMSMNSMREVRVIRSNGGKWKGCPKAGYRYDGLYRVTGQYQKRNKLGGMFFQFKLVRIDQQPAIVENAPTPALAAQINRVGQGITRRRQ